MGTLKRSNIFLLITVGKSIKDILASRLWLLTDGKKPKATGKRDIDTLLFPKWTLVVKKRSLFDTVSLLPLTSMALKKDPESMRYR